LVAGVREFKELHCCLVRTAEVEHCVDTVPECMSRLREDGRDPFTQYGDREPIGIKHFKEPKPGESGGPN
jgi:hypothetical protein